jgi:hypothetical protein
MKLKKELLGLAGEYAVASELCRNGVYAQLTLGHHKQTDILVETETRMLRISVKAKQGNEWPSISGLYRTDDFLALVDLKEKDDTERPDFYVLNLDDWKKLILRERTLRPNITVDEQNCITYADGWKGLNIKTDMVQDAKEKWRKITAQVAHTTS